VAGEIASVDELDVLGWLVDSGDPEAHLQILRRPEFVVPIVGSGISVPAGYPSARDLAAELISLDAARDSTAILTYPTHGRWPTFSSHMALSSAARCKRR
jgi:hypothetical protein